MNARKLPAAMMVAAALLTLPVACKNAPPQADAGASGPVSPLTAVMFGAGSKNEGEELFGRKCAFCHIGKGTGAFMLGRRLGKDKADLTKRTDLQADYVKAVVRNGLTNMPPFSRVEVTDDQLDKIAAYLSGKKSQ